MEKNRQLSKARTEDLNNFKRLIWKSYEDGDFCDEVKDPCNLSPLLGTVMIMASGFFCCVDISFDRIYEFVSGLCDEILDDVKQKYADSLLKSPVDFCLEGLSEDF